MDRSFPVSNYRNMLILARFYHCADNLNLYRKEARLNNERIERNRCSIREVTESDLAVLLQIEKECYSQPWSQQQFVQELRNPVASLLLGEIENRIVGYICYWLIDGEMEILNLATAPKVRRKGVAAQLMDEAFSRCEAKNLSTAWLEVRAANHPAMTLYRRSGFKSSGIRKGYYRDGEDAIVMVKIFTD